MHFLKFLVFPKRFTSFKKLSAFKISYFLFFSFCYAYLVADPISGWLGNSSDQVTFESIDIIKLISAIFIAPAFEEVIVRGFLTTKPTYYWTLPVFITFGCINCYFFKDYWFFTIFLVCLLGVLLIFFSQNRKRLMVRVFRKNYHFYFYVTALLFSFIHIVNMNPDLSLVARASILLVSFFPIAVLLGFIRVKYGLLYSILFHTLLNIGTLIINSFIY